MALSHFTRKIFKGGDLNEENRSHLEVNQTLNLRRLGTTSFLQLLKWRKLI